jgi:hypothetical protein
MMRRGRQYVENASDDVYDDVATGERAGKTRRDEREEQEWYEAERGEEEDANGC